MGLQRTRHALIVANGEPPPRALLRRVLSTCDLYVCADGGANTASRYRLYPHVIIGDLDSVRRAALRRMRTTDVIRIPEQDSTDLEKALAWTIDRGYRTVTVLGATGGRLDHVAGNLSALAKYSRHAHIRFMDADGELLSVGRRLVLDLPRGTTVSLIPVGRCRGVSTRGLRWNLRNDVLEPGVRDSTSNVVTRREVTVSVGRGQLLFFRVFNALRRS